MFVELYGTEDPITIGDIKISLLVKALEFCEYINDHAIPEIEKPLKSTDFSTLVEEWYANYTDVE